MTGRVIPMPSPGPVQPVGRPSVWQENAASFATHAESAIDQERHAGVRRALDYLEKGMPGRAEYELTRTVMRQARVAGLGDVDLGNPCPCGGRCQS